jgi:hypothetical protein
VEEMRNEELYDHIAVGLKGGLALLKKKWYQTNGN